MMKTRFVLTSALAVLVLMGAAISQTSSAQHKPKPSAARVAPEESVAAPKAARSASPAISTSPAPAPSTAPTEQRHQAPVSALNDKNDRLEMASTAVDGLTLPVGTTVHMKLENALSTTTNKAGDGFSGRVTEPVLVQGKTMIPVGASVAGRVTQVNESRRIRGVPMIDLKPESVTLPNGERYSIAAVVVDTSDPRHHNVDDEGRIKGPGFDKNDVRNLGVGAGLGAITGAVLKETVKGSLIGAGIGGSAMLVHWLWKRRTENIPAGTELYLELSRPVSLSYSSAGR
jgi:hypothetical protein